MSGNDRGQDDPKKSVFPASKGAVDAIPTADEGDALLDLLFDDASRKDPPSLPPPSEAPAPRSPVGYSAPPPDYDDLDDEIESLGDDDDDDDARTVIATTVQEDASGIPAISREDGGDLEQATVSMSSAALAFLTLAEKAEAPESPLAPSESHAVALSDSEPVAPFEAEEESGETRAFSPRSTGGGLATESAPPRRSAFTQATQARLNEGVTAVLNAAPVSTTSSGGADWMEDEAQRAADPATQCRLWLALSELRAAAGDLPGASEAAARAAEIAPQNLLAGWQARSLSTDSGQSSAAGEALANLARHTQNPELAAHAGFLSSEIARLVDRDEARAAERRALAAKAYPADPRDAVQTFVDRARAGARPADLAGIAATDKDNPRLAEATRIAALLRGLASTHPEDLHHPAAVLLRARRLIESTEPDTHHQLLDVISTWSEQSYGHAAGWLVGLLGAARLDAHTTPVALSALHRAAGGSAPDLARVSQAMVSVAAGVSVEARLSQTLAPTARIALGAIEAAGGPMGSAAREALPGLVDEASAQANGSPEEAAVLELSQAALGALLSPSENRMTRLRYMAVLSDESRAARVLARTLADPPKTLPWSTLELAVSELEGSAPELSPELQKLAQALRFELDATQESRERIESFVTSGPEGRDAAAELVLALLAEKADDLESSKLALASAMSQGGQAEVLLRMLHGKDDPDALTADLTAFADALPPGARRGLLALEAAHATLQKGGSSDDPSALLEADPHIRAAAEGPLPILGAHLGELSARLRADQSSLIEWLRSRREASDDRVEAAHDQTREALLTTDGESPLAAELMESATAARPRDFGLRDLYERLSTDSPADRATWREERAKELAESSPLEAARLALEAAYEYERMGDLESAYRAAKLVPGNDPLLSVLCQRLALLGAGTAEVVEALLPLARTTQDPEEQLELYEQLADLDERGRGDAASGLLFRRSILEDHPRHLRTLRRVESVLMAQGRTDELEPVALEIARAGLGDESLAHAALSVRLRARLTWEHTEEAVQVAAHSAPDEAWVLRQVAAHARANGRVLEAAETDRALADKTERPAERATLLLRAAESFLDGEASDVARECLETAVDLAPEHIVARLRLAELYETDGEISHAAEHLDAVAEMLESGAWANELRYRAATLFQAIDSRDRAQAALERICAADLNYADAFDKLTAIYVAKGDRIELADLLARRLEGATDPATRVEMEVQRGRALFEVGDQDAAKRALAAALDENPDHVVALESFAELCHAEGDFEGAEQALIRLARLAQDPDQQVGIYLRLGALYDTELPNVERAEIAYQEVRKRRPSDAEATRRLVALYRRSGSFVRAVEEQNSLVSGTEDPDEKCERTVELADILEEMGEAKKAENTLIAARKTYPKSDLTLRALVQFYERTGQSPAAAVLLDRTVADARRALATGRFETFLFEGLATAAELRNRPEGARAARAAVCAIEGEPVDFSGVEGRAGAPSLDDLLAPDVMTPAFRELLLQTGPMLDQAFPYDTDGVRATPLGAAHAELRAEAQELGAAYGLGSLELLSSNVLGSVCLPARAHPPTLVVGQTLADQPPTLERTFLLHRALKVLQANAAVLARTAPIDLWPLLGAYLRVFNPQFSPQGVDAARFSESFGRLSRTMPEGLSSEVAILASEVVGSIGNRASTLNASLNGWGSRAGLLAIGDPNVALTAIAWASGNSGGPPKSGKDRLTWIGRNAEARDLLIFAVSDGYVDARARLG